MTQEVNGYNVRDNNSFIFSFASFLCEDQLWRKKLPGLPWSGKKYLEKEIFSRSEKSQGILLMAREI